MPLPELRFPEVRAGRPEVDLADLRGRPAVVNVLAAWCAPCEKELPAMQAVHEQLGDRIQFVGIDRQDSRRKATELLDKAGVTFPVAYDPDDILFPRLRAIGMPTTLFVNADGKIVAKVSGELTKPDLLTKIAEHLDVS
jgi:cytochrome c biogenesis protein CcmG, thiol:disulfide interchange protein DsbE